MNIMNRASSPPPGAMGLCQMAGRRRRCVRAARVSGAGRWGSVGDKDQQKRPICLLCF